MANAMTDTKRTIGRVVFGVAAAALGAMALAGPAVANPTSDYQTPGANIRSAPDGNSAVIGQGSPGQGVTTICGTFGPDAYPDNHPGVVDYWILHVNNATGVKGYSAGSNMNGFINRIPDC